MGFNSGFKGLIVFTDDATYSREGDNNTCVSHWWSEENPHATVLKNFRHCLSANVWCGIIDNQLIDPVTLEHDLRGRNYLDFPRNELPRPLEDVPSATRNGLYYHDGASPHSILPVIHYLNETFPGRRNDRGGPVQWPPRAQDLTPLEFCLWGSIKSGFTQERCMLDTNWSLTSCVLLPPRRNVKKLKRTTRDPRKRVAKCIEVDDGIFEHLF